MQARRRAPLTWSRASPGLRSGRHTQSPAEARRKAGLRADPQTVTDAGPTRVRGGAGGGPPHQNCLERSPDRHLPGN